MIMKTQYEETAGSSSLISTAALIGALVGQLVFGILADRIGKAMFKLTK